VREIVLDTETTGLSPGDGNRIVEIGCIELVNHLPTGQTFHCHINPEMAMPTAAFEVHGHSDAFLADKPKFAAIVDGFLAFIGDAALVIHNAAFDLGFLNAELKRLGLAALPASRAIDTVAMARRKFPGAPASLDALCRRFSVDNSARTIHGALLDAALLAEVYLELIGGRQPALGLAAAAAETGSPAEPADRQTRAVRQHAPTTGERAAHAAFVDGLNDPIWRK
jgi:DNA polymerase-3 subunit epsilon